MKMATKTDKWKGERPLVFEKLRENNYATFIFLLLYSAYVYYYIIA